MGIKNYWLDRKKPACEKKWKRCEMFSAYGTSFIFKDDANLPSGTWIDPTAKVVWPKVLDLDKFDFGED